MVTAEDRARVTAAVAAAEAGTAAEIVPVVARASGRYDRAEDLVGLWCGGALVVAAWAWLPHPAGAGSWGGWPAWATPACLVGALVLGFVSGAFVASRWTGLRRLFTPRAEMVAEVDARAAQTFFDRRVHHTEGASGVLLYVSLAERRAVVFADAAALAAVGQPALDELRDRLVAGLAAGGVIDALCATVAAAGETLAAVLPRADDDRNELDDALVVLD